MILIILLDLDRQVLINTCNCLSKGAPPNKWKLLSLLFWIRTWMHMRIITTLSWHLSLTPICFEGCHRNPFLFVFEDFHYVLEMELVFWQVYFKVAQSIVQQFKGSILFLLFICNLNCNVLFYSVNKKSL